MSEIMIDVPGRLNPVDIDRVLGGADVIFDDDLGKRQSEINASVMVSIKGVTKVIHITEDMQLSENPDENTQTDVVIVNDTDETHFVGVSNQGYRTPDGNIMSVSVPVGGYAEVNFLNINGTIFVRGV